MAWKEDHPPLPTNYAVARNQTRHMVRRLSKDPDLLEKYSRIMEDQKARGFIEIVNSQNADREHYIPHHPVYKESLTTLIRIVFDCSCRQSANEPSLNDCLLPGLPILNDLTHLLVRFRTHAYGITTEIEKAFLQIALEEEDRNMTRFFWLNDPIDPESKFDIYRFKVVLFGATSSPFILSATLTKHLDQSEEPMADIIKRAIYVGNIVSGAANEEKAISYFYNSRSLMSTGSFNLRSWASNSNALQQLATLKGVQNSSQNIKVLGLLWQTLSDTLTYSPCDLSSPDHEGAVTKRTIRQGISKVYDPLGVLSPVIVKGKLLMQTLWLCGLEWDVPVPQEIEDTWKPLARDIKEAQHLTIPRCYFPDSNNSLRDVELHIFTDASHKAYGVVAYVISIHNKQSAFVIAKTRVNGSSN